MNPRSGALAAAGAALVAGAVWWRTHPSACPYGQRWVLELPRPYITRGRLLGVLGATSGERILEVGPGGGYYTLAVAEVLAPDGQLDLLDVQQEMLDHTTARAAAAGTTNVDARRGDAQQMPYDDGTFDAAYLVTVLGEIPDQGAALRELARVVRPGGRVVVGELFGDPHWVRPGALRRRAVDAGFAYERRLGTALAYFARFRRP